MLRDVAEQCALSATGRFLFRDDDPFLLELQEVLLPPEPRDGTGLLVQVVRVHPLGRRVFDEPKQLVHFGVGLIVRNLLPGGNDHFPAELRHELDGPRGRLLRDLEAVFDVPVRVSVVLGRTRMPIADLHRLDTGSIIELDRQVGEAIEIYVNDRLVARGEIVLVENDLAFHLEICKLSKNRQTLHAFTNIQAEVQMLITMAERQFESQMAAAVDHWPVVEALRTRNCENAMDAIRDHIRDSWRHLLEAYERDKPRSS